MIFNILILEAARCEVGWLLLVAALFFILYACYASFFPGLATDSAGGALLALVIIWQKLQLRADRISQGVSHEQQSISIYLRLKCLC